MCKHAFCFSFFLAISAVFANTLLNGMNNSEKQDKKKLAKTGDHAMGQCTESIALMQTLQEGRKRMAHAGLTSPFVDAHS